jgi:hypothetical protein
MLVSKSIVPTILIAVAMSASLYAQGPGSGPGSGMGPGSGSGEGPGSGYDLGSFPGWGGHELERNLVLPQVAVGESIKTTLVLFNLGHTQRMQWLEPEELITEGSILFFANDGQPLQVNVNGEGPLSEFPFSMEASEMLYLEITSASTNPVTTGWALIKIDDESEETDWGFMDGRRVGRGEHLMVTGFYSLRDNTGQLQSEVGVLPAVYEKGRFFSAVIAAQWVDKVKTGVAIVNTSDQDAAITLTLRGASGNALMTASMTLAAGHQTAKFINELFSSEIPAGFRGILEIDTDDEGVVCMGLLMSDGIFTSIPTHHFGGWSN